MMGTVEQLRWQAHTDQWHAVADDLRAEVSPALWERIQEFSVGMVQFVRLAAEMLEGHPRPESPPMPILATRLREPDGLCCAIRRDGQPCPKPARYVNPDDDSRTCGYHKQRAYLRRT